MENVSTVSVLFLQRNLTILSMQARRRRDTSWRPRICVSFNLLWQHFRPSHVCFFRFFIVFHMHYLYTFKTFFLDLLSLLVFLYFLGMQIDNFYNFNLFLFFKCWSFFYLVTCCDWFIFFEGRSLATLLWPPMATVS